MKNYCLKFKLFARQTITLRCVLRTESFRTDTARRNDAIFIWLLTPYSLKIILARPTHRGDRTNETIFFNAQ